MQTISSVPATMRSMSDSSSWAIDGLMTNSPSTRPTRTAETISWNGTSLRARAAEAPVMLSTSAWKSVSAETMKATTWVSWRKPSGNSGRSGPVDEPRRDRLALGGARLALEETARDLAGGVGLVAILHEEREEIAIAGFLSAVTVMSDIVSPMRTTQLPLACLAMRPVSRLSVVPLISRLTTCFSIVSHSFQLLVQRAAPVAAGRPGGEHNERSRGGRSVDRVLLATMPLQMLALSRGHHEIPSGRSPLDQVALPSVSREAPAP